MTNNVMNFLQESIDAGVIPLCKCGNPCGAAQTRKKGPNQYRWFFCCNALELYHKCNFFQWIPEEKRILGKNLVNKTTGLIK